MGDDGVSDEGNAHSPGLERGILQNASRRSCLELWSITPTQSYTSLPYVRADRGSPSPSEGGPGYTKYGSGRAGFELVR
jgi:hypothetical protein